MKKHINKIIIILIILNALTIGLVFAQSYEKSKTIKLDGNNLVSEVEITYDVQANPLSKVEISDLTTTNAPINRCVGNIGQSIDISGNFFDFQLKEAQVTMKYDESKLEETDEEDIGVLWYDKENNKMVIMESEVNTEANTISFKTDHFSEYILIDLETWHNAWNERLIKAKDENSSAFDIAFVIDDSGSMSSNDPQNARLIACEEFIKILRDKDGYSIISFEYGAEEKQPLTTNKSDELIKAAIEKFGGGGGTNIAAGLEKGISVLDSSESLSKIIVLLTDGEDAGLTSQKEKIITEALNKNITIYSIFLNASKEEYNKDNTLDIQEIAQGTGGKFYYISSDEVIDIFNDISKESVGIDENSKDSDGDTIYDEIELGGIRNQFGEIIFLNPNNPDTDGDGIPDNEEIGEAKENEDGSVYYEFKSDPLVANESILMSYNQSHQGAWIKTAKILQIWDSGFKLNKNAFQFKNISVNNNGGVCAGISYVIEKTYNQENIEHNIDNPEIPEFVSEEFDYEKLNNYPNLKEFVKKANAHIAQGCIANDKDKSKKIKELKENPNIYVLDNIDEAKAFFYDNTAEEIEEIYKEKIYYLHNDIEGFKVEDENIKNGSAYFYNPTGILKSYTKDGEEKKITYKEQIKNDADGNLIRELFYYWMYENKLSNYVIANYKIDYNEQATEETITKLKSIFSNKEIIRIDIKGHVIIGYSLVKVSESEYRIYVYDNNAPYYKGENRYIRLLKAYGKNNQKVYIVGKDENYNYIGSIFNDDEEPFKLVLEKDDEILNFEKKN